MNKDLQVIGYLHIIIQTIAADEIKNQIYGQLSIGELSKVDTSKKQSGSIFNETFLLQIPENPSRLTIIARDNDNVIGECRYDVNSFIEHEAITHSVSSDLFNNQNEKKGSVRIKITFFSNKYGKLKVRIFQLYFHPTMVEQFKQAKVKVKFGIYAQSTQVRPLDQNFDETVTLLVLNPKMNLTFDVMHSKGLLASYTIKNAEEGGMLNKQSKAFQVSLFNNQKAIGMIKYQLDWFPRF